MYEYSAEHSLAAVWTIVSSTVCNWVGGPAHPTLSTSPVAVCCSPRLFQFAGESRDLFLEIGRGYLCGRRVASLGPIRALTLYRLSASTASLHVARLRPFTTMLNPMQILASAPRHDGRVKDAGMIQ